MMPPLKRALSSILLLSSSAAAYLLEQHSFEPPFTHVEPSGTKGVSKDWKTAGVASVQNNFLRLTPDRQSKKGAVWSRKALGTSTFSSVLTFRISGQGKKFFGDGMALWCMQQAYYVEGDFHGSVERFKGFGVVFDTFKNTETLAYHRDVAIVVNDGEKTVEIMLEKKEGCDASIRYHEDRGDFSVKSTSRAKITVEGLKVSVAIDAKNDGAFVECATAHLPENLGEDWAKTSHLGVSASTGQLADNHDVISLVTFSDLALHDEHLAIKQAAPTFARGEGVSSARFERLEDKVSELVEKLDYLSHHMEHELAAVSDHNKMTIGKLQAAELVSEGRIDELEKAIKNSVTADVGKKMKDMTQGVDSSLTQRLAEVESKLREGFDDKVAAATQGLSTGGWKLPFFLLFAMMVACAAGLYKWYQQLKKTHML